MIPPPRGLSTRLGSAVDRVGGRLLDGLFPTRCELCRLRSHRALPLCAGCARELVPNRGACPRCALPLQAFPRVAPVPCGACQREPPPFARVIAPWLYEEHLAYLIGRWKFAGEQWLTPLLAALWREGVEALPAADLVVPVPLHWTRRWRRGFNQAEELARVLCSERSLHGRLAPRLLRRLRPTPPQSGMDARLRARNLRGAFTVAGARDTVWRTRTRAAGPCAGLRVAVVDDVLTTGATAREVAGALTAAGARRVEIWCLARTPAPGH